MTYDRKFGVEFEIINVSAIKLAHTLYLAGIKCRYFGFLVKNLPKNYSEMSRDLLETYEDENYEDYSLWNIKYDASVIGGFELVSPPLKGKQGFKELRKVCKILESLEVRVNKSCGLHVHLDATDLDAHDVNTIILRYAKWESVIDQFFHESRRGDNCSFCLPMQEVANAIVDMAILDNDTWGYDRYWKVNPEALDDHGTVEFRQHNGAYRAKTVIPWIKFLLAFVERSKDLSEAKQSGAKKVVDRSPFTLVTKGVANTLKARRNLDFEDLNLFV